MAVRRKKAEGGDSSSLDSLMDALTNVVAVLIFVLLLVNCDVAQTVVKIMEDIVPVSEEEMRKAQEMLKQIDLDAKRLEELKKQPQPSKLEFEELQKALEALKKLKDEKLKKIEAHGGEMAELQRRHDEAQAARDTEQQKNVAMQEEIRRLEILLDTTPVEKDIPATDITIPASRPIPEGAKVVNVFVVDNQVIVADPDSVMEQVLKNLDNLKKNKDKFALPEEEESEEEVGEDGKKLSAAERRAAREKKKAEAKIEKPILFDKDKSIPELGKFTKTPPGRWYLISQPWWGHAALQGDFHGLKEGATTLEQLAQPSNPFTSALSKIRPPNEVVMFQVHPESLYTYAKAREIVDKKGIPAGWNVTGAMFVRIDVPGYSAKPTGPPPERPPGWKPPKEARGTGGKLD
jgi:hypothetical protein